MDAADAAHNTVCPASAAGVRLCGHALGPEAVARTYSSGGELTLLEARDFP